MRSSKALRTIDEGKVSLMKGSHGGHEDQRPGQPPAEPLHPGNRFNYSHIRRSAFGAGGAGDALPRDPASHVQ